METAKRQVIGDLDIYRSADLLVKHHGEDTPTEAAMRAENIEQVGSER